ncbi:hypothetical protein [Rhizobium sp. SL86]|uniref:hypothetical protein n=1 Tax=Rhizobium sp. SL86 TaxID=2995148 RepID=UPI00227420F0|nr:hypothetical protein [Rhizobium sp. SL86]MCY1669078.1 hypothetical protein [Rhizobium sp. SL86]
MRVGLRVYLYSMLVIIAALALLGMMSIVKYETILTETLAKRLSVVVDDTGSSIEKAGTLGVTLRSLAQQPTGPVAGARQLLAGTATVLALDMTGRPIAVGGEQQRLPFSTELMADRIAAKEKSWHLRAEGFLIAGTTVINSFGEAEGAIVALLPDAVIETRDDAMLARIIQFGVIVLVPTAILAAVLIFFSIRPLGRSIHAMRNVVEEREQPDGVNLTTGPLAPTLQWFSRIFGDLEKQRKEADETLDAIETLARMESGKHGQ